MQFIGLTIANGRYLQRIVCSDLTSKIMLKEINSITASRKIPPPPVFLEHFPRGAGRRGEGVAGGGGEKGWRGRRGGGTAPAAL